MNGRMNSQALAGTLLRGAAVLALAVVLAAPGQPWLLKTLAPHWARVAQALDPDFRVEEVQAGREGADLGLRMVFVPARFVIVGPHVLAPGEGHRGTATLPRGTPWQLAALFATALAAWPFARGVRLRRAAFWRLLLGAAGGALVLLTLVPLELLGQLRGVLLQQLTVDGGDWRLAAAGFLGAGGRVLVALALAALCALAADRAATPRVT